MSIETIIHENLFQKWKRLKTRQRAQSIVEATVSCYHRYGIEGTTYDKIAEQAGISRPLIFKYFKDHQELFETTVKYIRVHFQVFAVSYMEKEASPTGKLKAYVMSTFGWLEKYPEQSGAFLLYLHKCTTSKKNRKLNTEFTQTGADRISQLVLWGIKEGDFQIAPGDIRPKLIQTIIAGAMITMATENLEDRPAYKRHVQDLCLEVVGAKSTDK